MRSSDSNLIAFATLLVAVAAAQAAANGQTPQYSAEDLQFFEKQVRPLFVDHCYECHGEGQHAGGLQLTSRSSILKGGDTGPAVVAGKPAESLLIDAIMYGDLYQMPPKSKLSEKDIRTIIEWVERGAPWPAHEDQPTDSPHEDFDLAARKASHWAWQPVEQPAVPSVKHTAWPNDPLDRFILARLESDGIYPAPPVEPNLLIRRVYFDLIGLPPPADKVKAFADDPSPQALAKIVDELLASKHFGERWARHWLDLMRYAETRGHEFDYLIPNAWQYRDYLVRALNADVPYDQFVTEHIAGDLLDPPRTNSEHGFNESVLATGFWYLGEWVHSPVDIRKDETDRMDNAIDVYSKAFLGLTVSCARCHDHKFDAISQADYYALGGFLQSSTYQQVRFETQSHNREIAAQLSQLRETISQQVASEIARQTGPMVAQLETMLTAAAEVLTLREQGQSPELALLAKKQSVPPSRLAAWVAELEQARSNDRHPLHQLSLSATSGISVANEIGSAEVESSSHDLGDQYQIVVDYRDSKTPWLTDGPAFGNGPLMPGTLLLGTDATKPIEEIIEVGQARLDPELAKLALRDGTKQPPWFKPDWKSTPGTLLRTPNITLNAPKLYYLIRGGSYVQAVVDSHRAIAGPLHGRTRIKIENEPHFRWVEHDLSRYQGHGLHVEFSAAKDTPLSLIMVVAGDQPPPHGVLTAHQAQNVRSVSSQTELIQRLSHSIRQSLEQLGRGAAITSSSSPLHRYGGGARGGGLKRKREVIAAPQVNDSGEQFGPQLARTAAWAANNPQLWSDNPSEQIESLLAGYQTQRKELLGKLRRKSATAPAMCDVSGVDETLLVRGNSATPGKPVSRRMITAIAGDSQPPIESGSGRLELARRTLSPDNPFASRVIVNRIWHHLTGRGIVPSVDNFGVLGQPPTHPKLLDHLASEFIADGWSIKHMIRRIVLSRTYQMASNIQPNSLTTDPQNLLYHRMPMRRLEGEVIRDAMLSINGTMDSTLGGPSVPVHLTTFMQGRGRPGKSGPADGARRRSIYQEVRRNFLSPMMIAFDTPQPSSPRGGRTISNVPAQALTLMNDTFVAGQAEKLAQQLLQQESNPADRIDSLYWQTLARPPMPVETEAALAFLKEQSGVWNETGPDETSDTQAWTDLCHVIFNTKEFIFLR